MFLAPQCASVSQHPHLIPIYPNIARLYLITYVECKYYRKKACGRVSPMILEPVFIDIFHKRWIVNQNLGKIGKIDSLVKHPRKNKTKQNSNKM